jgi:MFS family permease
MARSFHQIPLHMSVALTSYLISLAVFIPASGWVADHFGARQVFRAAIIVFALASVFCGFAPSLLVLVAARILQGLGGAMMIPVGRLLLLRSATRRWWAPWPGSLCRLWLAPCWARRWAALSSRIFPGAGCSTSTSPLASSASSP